MFLFVTYFLHGYFYYILCSHTPSLYIHEKIAYFEVLSLLNFTILNQ